jgi:hypothetical protein
MSLFALVLLGGTSAGAPVASTLAAAFGPRAPFSLHGRSNRGPRRGGRQYLSPHSTGQLAAAR